MNTVWFVTDILKTYFLDIIKTMVVLKFMVFFYNSDAKISVWQRKYLNASYLVVTIFKTWCLKTISIILV